MKHRANEVESDLQIPENSHALEALLSYSPWGSTLPQPQKSFRSWKPESSKRADASERYRSRKFLPRLAARSGTACDLCSFPWWDLLVPHHIRFLEHGGESDMFNLVAVCPTCHSLIHFFRRKGGFLYNCVAEKIAALAGLHFTEEKARRLLAIATEGVAILRDGTIIDRARLFPSERRPFRKDLRALGVALVEDDEVEVRV